MRTTQLDNGMSNVYATEPKVYYAEYPSMDEQRQYALMGAIAVLFVTTLTLVSLAVS